ncbi:DUF2510 domain-containing protein [Microbacterium sp. MYb62]|uniref:DUF2510 domain-containing protein n=1 Tax=Microbacterium sp. MYb62 TaxID=1848690 RepID=UPI000CFB80A2|nr:DUF2510 domain-containing protein [Microbacterium sp. MYb62]PRB15962.1 hypothetical protein CQ042_07535 [Microbacterium sp. MYb62]
MSDDGAGAGWYETRRRGTLRWWDGAQWTPRIEVRGRETTLAAESASVRRQLVVTEMVLVVVLAGAILIALWGSLPVVTVRPVIVATGAALVVVPLVTRWQLRLVALPARGLRGRTPHRR